jgi:hypothetical protein
LWQARAGKTRHQAAAAAGMDQTSTAFIQTPLCSFCGSHRLQGQGTECNDADGGCCCSYTLSKVVVYLPSDGSTRIFDFQMVIMRLGAQAQPAYNFTAVNATAQPSYTWGVS